MPILDGKAKGHLAVVVAIDRDRQPDDQRIIPLTEGRDAMQHDRTFPPCAVGVAVEAFDAWMIVDGEAVGKIGGNNARCHPDPEKMDGVEGTGKHPKDRAADIFGGGHGLSEKYAEIAARVDLELLAKCCARGFAPFAADVRERLASLSS